MKDRLNDLRDDLKHSNNEVAFKKRLFGGYNGKEVSEYIKTLKESLENAEVSFRGKLEEYAAMSVMLQQERDTYMNMCKENEENNREIQQQVNTILKENEELTIKLQESKEGLVSQDDLLGYESIALENEELIKELNAYNGKEVSEYIKTLKESLENAEVSFRKKLEESAEMAARLEQERDTYMNISEKNEESNREIQQRMNTILKENEELTIKLQESKEGLVSQDDLLEHESIALENEELKKELNAYKKNIQDYAELNKQLNQLKATVKDLNTQIEDYEENEATQQSYDIILAENEIIKQKYEEAVYESSVALAEKESFIEQNKRISDSLIEVNENNKELRNAITTSKLKTRKMIAEFEARVYECAQNHRKNIDEIAENISNTLKILHNENKDIANLISSPFGEFGIETEDANEELESTTSFVEGLETIASLIASMEKKLLSKKKY